MKNIRFVLAIFFLGSLTISLTTCAGSLALNGIVITPANTSIPTKTTQQFTATGYYNDQTNHDITTQVTWSSSNPLVATIDSNGLATAVSIGPVTITANSTTPNSVNNEASTASTTLTVTPPALSSIAVTPANQSIPVGAFQQFAATGTYNNGTSFDLTDLVIWSSSNTSVAAIEGAGLLLGVSVGTTTITATYPGNISGTATLTVNNAALLSLSVTPVNPSIPVGVPLNFTAIGNYNDGTSFITQVTWSSSNLSVATINSTGLALAVSVGTITITGTSITITSISESTTLTVNPATLSSLAVIPASSTLYVGLAEQLKAIGTYSDGTSFDITTQVVWISSNISVATVTTGVTTAVSAGTTTITAISITNIKGISGSATLTVLPVPLSFITVTPANPAINALTTIQFTATATYSDGSTKDITDEVAWSSSNTSEATISSTGVATAGQVPGVTTITATLESISGSTTLTVD